MYHVQVSITTASLNTPHEYLQRCFDLENDKKTPVDTLELHYFDICKLFVSLYKPTMKSFMCLYKYNLKSQQNCLFL